MGGASFTQYLGGGADRSFVRTPAPPEAAPAVRAYLDQLETTYFFGDQRTPESLASLIAYYRTRAPWGRTAFRVSGVLIIAIGALLPFVAGLGNQLTVFGRAPNKDIVLSIMALALSMLAGLNQFFRWDERWKANTQSLFRLQRLRASWELEKIRACHMQEPDAAIAALQSAAETLIQRAHEVAGEEMESFFRLQKAPERTTSDVRV